MGFPLRPTLANLVLEYHERKWLESRPIQFRPKYYCRYIDNICLMFEHKDNVKKFLRYMNSRHCNIQSTCKEESNNKISFLDISIAKSSNKLVTSLYRKETYLVVFT